MNNRKFKIYVGTDHAGFRLKEKITPYLTSLGYEVLDFGAHGYDESDDYPDYISKVASAVSLNPENIRGVIFGGSGQGEAIVANRYPNVRAIVYYGGGLLSSKKAIVKLGRQHNDSNILSIGARYVSVSLAKKAIREWLQERFEGSERHARRIKKIERISREIKNNPNIN
jgi:ribose 5-phosphate isomerase B